MEGNDGKMDSFLGERPWDTAHLRKCYFRDFVSTRREIEALPGGKLFSELKTLRLSLKIFLGAVDDLLSSINKFKSNCVRPQFWHDINRPFADEIEIAVQRGVLCSTMCAIALVDHCREFAKDCPITAYEDKVQECFSRDELHGFVHSLRRYITHIRFTKANWVIKQSREGRAVFFLLDSDTLSRFADWSATAKAYISSHGQGVNIEALFEQYARNVADFHGWLFVSVFQQYNEILSEYLNYLRLVNGFSSESNWNILLNQIVKPKRLNPYLFLNHYLLDDQMQDIFSRPYRSKEQIDRIIELIDSYQICTETLRQDAYEAFAAKT